MRLAPAKQPSPMRTAAISAALVLLAGAPLLAESSLRTWYQSLMRNDGKGSCCDTADCRPVDYRTSSNGYEVFFDGEWKAVPKDVILQRHDNPTGGAVVCIDHLFRTILCFVPGTEM